MTVRQSRLAVFAGVLVTLSLEAGSPAAQEGVPVGVRCATPSPPGWTSYDYDGRHSRCFEGGTRLAPDSIHRLRRLWQIPGLNGVTSTPVVDDGVVWFGDWQGRLHQVDLQTGQPRRPALQLPTPQIAATPLLTRDHIYVPAMQSLIRLNRHTLAIDWQTWPDPERDDIDLDSSPVLAAKDGIIVMGVSSQEVSAEKEDYSFRGAVVGIDAATGSILWRVYTTRNDATAGAGVSVWSSAALDEERGLAYIGTGQTYEAPASPLSDALLCIDYRSGRLVWSHQYTPDDVWVTGTAGGGDYDIGASPHLFTAGGRPMVAVGSKAGIYKAFDRVTGEVVWETHLGGASPIGGVMVSGAMADGILYTASNNGGTVETRALSMDSGATLWSRSLEGMSFGNLVLAGGVLLQSTLNGEVHALDGATGRLLHRLQLPGSPGGGFSVAGDTVLIGYGWAWNSDVQEPDEGGLVALQLRPQPAGNVAPEFYNGQVRGDPAVAGRPYAGSMTGLVSDDNGDSLKFSLISGPEWLRLSPEGQLSGTPADGDAGEGVWRVRVSDGALDAEADLLIRVSLAGGLPPLSKEAARVLREYGCTTCHGPGGTLNLAEWPFRYGAGAVNPTDDPAEILLRIVRITDPAAVPRMPPGPPLPEADRDALVRMFMEVSGFGQAGGD